MSVLDQTMITCPTTAQNAARENTEKM